MLPAAAGRILKDEPVMLLPRHARFGGSDYTLCRLDS